MVIMFSYALFAMIMLIDIQGLVCQHRGDIVRSESLAALAHFLLYPAVFLLAAGIFIGAVWANVSWGRYWSWDPKETWAAATWAVYLAYLHCRLRPATGPAAHRLPYACLIIGFLLLQMCWYGVNYLPAAAESMHSYME